MEIWKPEPPGTLWATPGLLWDCFTFTFLLNTQLFFQAQPVAHLCQIHSASTISTFPYFAVFILVQVTWSLRTV